MSSLSRIPDDRDAAGYNPAHGFYSALARTIRHIRKVAGADGNIRPDQALTWIAARQRDGWFKLSELHWSGLDDWLKTRQSSVHVSDIISFVRDNGVRVAEVVKGIPPRKTGFATMSESQLRAAAIEEHGPQYLGEDFDFDDPNQRALVVADLESTQDHREAAATMYGDGTKYKQHSLPGGSNYRELLLTLPMPAAQLQAKRDGSGRLAKPTPEDIAAFRRVNDPGKAGHSLYTSNHWDEPNILAHIRFNERVDAAGRRVLFIEELQSDWAQDGLKHGFGTNSIEQAGEWWNIKNQRGQVIDQQDTKERAEQVVSRMRSIPAAPFVTDTKAWLSLSIKRIIQYGVEHGYDRVAFITGEQSAQRYGLSKAVESVEYRQRTEGPKEGTGLLTAYDDSGNQVLSKVDARASDLADVIGYEAAARLMQSPGPGYTDSSDKAYVLTGESLKVGGQGMRVFYDRIVPQTINEVLKKLDGGRVGLVELGYGGEPEVVGIDGEGAAIYNDGAPEGIQQPGFDITPGLRSSVEEGMPLFSRFNPQRSQAMSAAARAAARAVPAGAGVPLGRARPIDLAAAGRRVAPHIERILRDGRVSGETGENGLLLLRRALQEVALAGPHDLRTLAAKVERLLPRDGSVRLTIDDTSLTPMNGAVHLAPHVDIRLYTAEGRTGLAYETLLHESLHVGVAARYKSLALEAAREGKRSAAAAAIDRFHRLWREFCNAATGEPLENSELELSVREARRSPDEFFVRAMTDPVLQAYLASRQYNGKTLWQRFVGWIRTSLFGAKSQRLAPSWLDAALAASHHLADAMQRDPADFSDVHATAESMLSRSCAQEESPAFKRWFDASKAVDERGLPELFYHGTLNDFDAFKENARGMHFVSRSPDWVARFLAGESGDIPEGASIMLVYVAASNPFDYENKKHVQYVAARASLGSLAISQIKQGKWQRLEDRTFIATIKKLGFDGVYVKEDGVKNLAVFEPAQIKSAIGNRGGFDPRDPNILASLRVLALRPAVDRAADDDDLDAPASQPAARLTIAATTLGRWPENAGTAISNHLTVEGSHMPGQTSASNETDQALRAAIVAQLVAAGWAAIERSTAIALKTYDTAVGRKDAHAYLADFGPSETNYVLQGEYYSEGSNVLSARGILIPKDADLAAAKTLTERFATGAEAAVLDSYAARLLHKFGYRAGQAHQGEEEGEGGGEAPAPSM
ncbi:ADP-ribosyltransferase-containing protein [Massilia orientalis]|uniref:Uncharacterized protein n=1 Tax=Massilia orientalis TaxID=3050128 RepID=A0ACC7MDJ5_9BURK|nr:hypothetical protein [Massilia sp. YIM B02787]